MHTIPLAFCALSVVWNFGAAGAAADLEDACTESETRKPLHWMIPRNAFFGPCSKHFRYPRGYSYFANLGLRLRSGRSADALVCRETERGCLGGTRRSRRFLCLVEAVEQSMKKSRASGNEQPRVRREIRRNEIAITRSRRPYFAAERLARDFSHAAAAALTADSAAM